MAYTAPKTWSTGNTITAADLNTYVRDNVGWLATDKPHAKVRKTALQTIATATDTVLTFDTEDWDTGAMHSTVTNTGRLTVPTGGGGIYELKAGVAWATGATSYRVIAIRKNGTTFIARHVMINTGIVAEQNISWQDLAVAGDYYEAIAQQGTGGNLDAVVTGNQQTAFIAMWVASA